MLGASKIYKVICSSFLQLSAISRDPLLHPVCRFVVAVERLADVPLRRNRVLSLSRSKVSVAEAAKVDIG